jgi:VCBS repeat-containing protein
VRRNPEFLLREVAGRQVVVPVGAMAGKFYGMLTLNASGAYLWQLLEQPQTVETLVQALCQKYTVSQEVAQADVEKFLENLQPTGAIVE